MDGAVSSMIGFRARCAVVALSKLQAAGASHAVCVLAVMEVMVGSGFGSRIRVWSGASVSGVLRTIVCAAVEKWSTRNELGAGAGHFHGKKARDNVEAQF